MEALILSHALDTNGQNARYVRAAEKYGMDVLAIGNADPAGVVGRFQSAANKGDELRIRSAHRVTPYFQFPPDIIWTRHTEPQIKELAEAADVIHLNNSYRPAVLLRLRKKPNLLHHHGSLFRNNTTHLMEVAKGRKMTQAVSTIDLTRADPKVLHWLPTAYDLDELAGIGRAFRGKRDGRIRIVSAPTSRALKATVALEVAVRSLHEQGLPVDLVLVEGKSWKECLQIKSTADIYFDQLAFGYGCNSIEAWAMGIPVVAGADAWTLERMRKEWGALPFMEATAETLADVLKQMVKSKDLRAEYAARGLAHAQRFHAEKPALARLAELYGRTISNFVKVTQRSQVKAVSFVNRTNRPVWLEGEKVAFPEGIAKVTDPLVISRLRYFASKRPAYGISEL